MSSERSTSHNLATSALFEPAERHPDITALITPDARFSYRETADCVWRFARLLSDHGCGPGDRILFAMPDSIAFVGLFFGALAIGGVAIPVAPGTSQDDFDHIVRKSGARLAVCVEGSAVVPACSTLRLNPRAPQLPTSSADIDAQRCAAVAPEDLAYILFSSGSTGSAKGIPHRHADFLHCARAFAAVVDYRPGDIVLAAPKLSFGYALGCNLIFPLLAGATSILIEALPDDAILAEMARRFHPTLFVGQPRNLVGLIRAADTGLYDNLRLAVVAGEKLGPALIERWQQAWPTTPLLDCYGITETSGVFLANRPGEGRDGSVGRVLDGYQTRLIPVGGDQAAEDVGELWATGPSLCDGYIDDPEGDADRFRDGWVRTGDLFRRDADGYHYMLGRIDHLLKVGCGAWISPTDVEAVLQRDPAIAECAVIGFPDADGVIQLKACVAVAGQARPTRALHDGLIAAVADAFPGQVSHRLAAVEFVSDFPRTSTGKIDRRRLGSHSQTDFSYQC